MKNVDLTSLESFYGAKSGQALLYEAVCAIKEDLNVKNENVLGLGFCGNFLDLFEIKNLYFAIPKQYSIVHWPKIRPFRTVVVDTSRMPFSPETWDAVIVIHFMEFSLENKEFLVELFRILKKNGKLIVICVNKSSLNFFHKNISSIKNIKHEVSNIIGQLSEGSFRISNIFGINKRFKFWPYSFSYKLNKYNENIMDFFPILSDIIIISANKTELAAIPVMKKLDAQYDVI